MTSDYEKMPLKSDMRMHISNQFPNSKEQLNTQFPTSVFPLSLAATGPHFIRIAPKPLVLAIAIALHLQVAFQWQVTLIFSPSMDLFLQSSYKTLPLVIRRVCSQPF